MDKNKRMKRFVEALENELTVQDCEVHLEGCIGCGNCGHACAWYLVTNDPKYHPKTRSDFVRKVYRTHLTTRGRLLTRLGLMSGPSDEELEEAMSLFWNSCTMCGRCSLACMHGVSNRRITQITRTALNAAGIVPGTVGTIKRNATRRKHSFGLSFKDSVGQILRSGKEQGITIPVDHVGADYLWVCSAIINANIPAAVVDIAKMLNTAGVSYTLSSKIKDTGTEAQTIVVDPVLGKGFVERLEKEARRLKCKGIIVGECGCDVRTYCVDASRILKRQFGLEVAYIDPLLLSEVKSGRIPIERLDMKVTYHDPCWTGRQSGYFEEPRELLKLCVTDFVEMTPNRAYNYCCNAGAGPWRMWVPSNNGGNLRREASVLKARQIEQTCADYVVTPCTTCYLSLVDITSFYNLSAEADMVAGIACRAMEKALTKSGQLHRMRSHANGCGAIR
ncbi:MAG: (Fe-S)-binding protein [Chloroflexota bacterium]|nr:(Fe-S)-binding protein [Chloroflexota bacterium]